MEKDNIELKFAEGTKEVVLRNGTAPKVFDPIVYSNVSIAVQTLFNYVTGNVFPDKKSNSGLVTYCIQPDEMGIKFRADINDPLATSLEARLIVNKEYEDFGINRDKYRQGKDMMNFIRKMAHCFEDPKAPEAMIKALQNFEIKFEQVHKENDDRKGNTDKSVKTALKFVAGEMPLDWKIKMPLFKGTKPVSFVVSIEIEAYHGFPAFAFYSLEAEMLMRTLGESIIKAEVAKFEELFVVLETI